MVALRCGASRRIHVGNLGGGVGCRCDGLMRCQDCCDDVASICLHTRPDDWRPVEDRQMRQELYRTRAIRHLVALRAEAQLLDSWWRFRACSSRGLSRSRTRASSGSVILIQPLTLNCIVLVR